MTVEFRDIREASRVVRPAKAVGGGGGSFVKQFKIENDSDFADYLICRTWDGTDRGDTDFAVMKPHGLRRTPYHGLTVNDVTYTYVGNKSRDAEKDGVTVRETIFPDYEYSDIILAIKSVSGFSARDDDGEGGEAGEPILWHDLNVDARQFVGPAEAAATTYMKIRDGTSFGDFMICRSWDGSVEGTVDVPVLKNWFNRRLPFDGTGSRAGVSYTYDSNVRRRAFYSGGSEIQEVTPDYALGDIIAVDAYPASFGDLDNTGSAIVLIDKNHDGRMWGQETG